MSKMVRKIKVICLVFVLLAMVLLPNNVYAQTSNQGYSMGMVKEILDVYLKSNDYDIVYGTTEYAEYLTEQLVEESDQKLQKDPNIELIMDYASIYLQEVSEGTDVRDNTFLEKKLRNL